MVTSIILISTERSKINEVAEKLAETNGITEAYSVSGRNFDIIAMARVPSNDELANLVTIELSKIDAILKTETLLAFKAYSRHDLEAMFQVGI
jgi:DNA-binding Lrp family transcriptional regulator